ncbi:MAG TPA: dihydropteroate synthase [Planctomycetaceae bacterium]|nr:dihydropteroate synthase [Planctomycetaceae bacterium]
MGIVNVTPDSFSDGGKFFSPSDAVDHALRLEDEGASILDIGGESTRPYSEAVAVDDELARVVPVLESLMGRVSAVVSIDTSKAAVAQAAVDVGAKIINDVTGLEGDPEMIDVARNCQAGICAMHMQGTPQTMQDSPSYTNVTEDILSYLISRRDALLDAGIDAARVCLDPGIGFGKSHDHNIQLIRQCTRFHETQCPILVGHSRKGFIGKLSGDKSAERISGSVAVSLDLARKGVQVLRIHDVGQTHRALLCQSAIA